MTPNLMVKLRPTQNFVMFVLLALNWKVPSWRDVSSGMMFLRNLNILS
jgi:hypothetical protein